MSNTVGTFENFQSFSVAVPVTVTNTGTRRLIFRSANVMFALAPRKSRVLEPALHVYRVYTQVLSPVVHDGIISGEEPESVVEDACGDSDIHQTLVNISIASIAYSSPVLFMVHEGQAVDGASFTSSVPIVPRPQN